MIKIIKETNTSQQTKQLGELIGKYSDVGTSFTLSGNLGAGKTTLTKGIAKGMGITSVVNSPTFNICKIYYGDKKLVHIDAYRLSKASDELGFEEEMDDAITVVEWACNSDMELLNMSQITIESMDDNKRRIIFELNDQCNPLLVKELNLWQV